MGSSAHSAGSNGCGFSGHLRRRPRRRLFRNRRKRRVRPSQAPANPSNSFPLSNIEHYSPYTGAMSLVIPVRHIGGRGEAGYDVVVDIATHWSITKTFYLTDGEVSNVDPYTDTWPSVQNQPLGIALTEQHAQYIRRMSGGGRYSRAKHTSPEPCHVIRFSGTMVLRLPSATRAPTGPRLAGPGCNNNSDAYDNGRGSSAVTRDGSHILFQLTPPNKILDSVINGGSVLQTKAGTLTEPNGLRYQINNSGGVTSMEDGTEIRSASMPTRHWVIPMFGYFDPRSLASVTDSLGRVTSFNMSAPGGTIQKTGSYSATIQYTGYSGAQTITVGSAMLSNAVAARLRRQRTADP